MGHPVLLSLARRGARTGRKLRCCGDGKVSIQYQIYALPTEFFINSQGIIRTMLIESVTPKLLAEKLPLIGVEP